MRRSVKHVWRAALLAAAGALAACTSSLPDFTQVKLPSARTVMPQNVDTYVPPVSTRALKPVGPADLVDAQGMCAGDGAAARCGGGAGIGDGRGPAAPPTAGPAVPGPVGLEMTECEVVAAVGPPRSVNIASDERGARKVTMIFMGNERAGTYEFVGGRLKALERGPEPPAPPPQPKKKPATAKKRTSRDLRPPGMCEFSGSRRWPRPDRRRFHRERAWRSGPRDAIFAFDDALTGAISQADRCMTSLQSRRYAPRACADAPWRSRSPVRASRWSSAPAVWAQQRPQRTEQGGLGSRRGGDRRTERQRSIRACAASPGAAPAAGRRDHRPDRRARRTHAALQGDRRIDSAEQGGRRLAAGRDRLCGLRDAGRRASAGHLRVQWRPGRGVRLSQHRRDRAVAAAVRSPRGVEPARAAAERRDLARFHRPRVHRSARHRLQPDRRERRRRPAPVLVGRRRCRRARGVHPQVDRAGRPPAVGQVHRRRKLWRLPRPEGRAQAARARASAFAAW